MANSQTNDGGCNGSSAGLTSGLRPAPQGTFEVTPKFSADGRTANPWLHAYTVLTALTIWVLVFSGGLVTSKGVGLSVPDWPTSYGYNMFAFPISRWTGGIFYEHSHRLIASAVGFMTIILAVWLWMRESRRWLCWLGIVALVAVILQGVLGGLRVVWLKDQIGIFHACLAQAFFALVSFIALASSGWWQRLGRNKLSASQRQKVRQVAVFVAAVAILIYIQLALGAAMRHAHAGLSITDFPRAYGQWWPTTDAAQITAINQERALLNVPKTTAGLILLQMFHRLGAFLVASGVAVVTFKVLSARALLKRSLLWVACLGPILIAVQISLGIYTIWTNKAADIATLHVAVGAASLVWSVLTFAGLMRWSRPASTGTISPAILPAVRQETRTFAEVAAV